MRALLLLATRLAAAFTPYSPAPGWTVRLEAALKQPWPTCHHRFLTASQSGAALSAAPGPESELTLEAGTQGAFRLRLHHGGFLSYSTPCSETSLSSAKAHKDFALLRNNDSSWRLAALEREGCGSDEVGFSREDCRSTTATLNADGGRFWLHIVGGERRYEKAANSEGPCADPFLWHDGVAGDNMLVCTGGGLRLMRSSGQLAASSVFADAGLALSGQAPAWAQGRARWAPENLEFRAAMNVMFFSDSSGGRHRVGWAMSRGSKGLAGSYDAYSEEALDLGGAAGGEIDQHIFRDGDGRTYLLWKSDDNAVGAKRTRIWGQEVSISARNVTLLGSARELMDSRGLWWADSFVAGGSLIEGPELIHYGDFYYLFFAAGRFCTPSYSEGVARARSIWGPYEKMAVPLLSTGLTGYTAGRKQVGPGHASFLLQGGKFFVVYHASPGENCDRHAFVEELKFDPISLWPYVDFDAPALSYFL